MEINNNMLSILVVSLLIIILFLSCSKKSKCKENFVYEITSANDPFCNWTYTNLGSEAANNKNGQLQKKTDICGWSQLPHCNDGSWDPTIKMCTTMTQPPKSTVVCASGYTANNILTSGDDYKGTTGKLCTKQVTNNGVASDVVGRDFAQPTIIDNLTKDSSKYSYNTAVKGYIYNDDWYNNGKSNVCRSGYTPITVNKKVNNKTVLDYYKCQRYYNKQCVQPGAVLTTSKVCANVDYSDNSRCYNNPNFTYDYITNTCKPISTPNHLTEDDASYGLQNDPKTKGDISYNGYDSTSSYNKITGRNDSDFRWKPACSNNIYKYYLPNLNPGTNMAHDIIYDQLLDKIYCPGEGVYTNDKCYMALKKVNEDIKMWKNDMPDIVALFNGLDDINTLNTTIFNSNIIPGTTKTNILYRKPGVDTNNVINSKITSI